MPTTVIEQPLTTLQLRHAILDFAQHRDTGYLGTSGPEGMRVSPVKYFMDNDMNVYIYSRGGSKFKNLAVDPKACLLVSTPFQDDFQRIKGVQVFGETEVAEPGSQLYAIAEELCPWQHPDDAKLIFLRTDSVVYVDRMADNDIKQEWKR